MIRNEIIDTIFEKRRSYKFFTTEPVSDEILETVLMCGRIAPTAMNRQPWHFTVIKSSEAMEEFGRDLIENADKYGPFGPPPGSLPPGGPQAGGPPPMQNANMTPAERTRNAPLMIIVSGDSREMAAHIDCPLAMENMLLAAVSLGLDTGWDFGVNKDFFEGPGGAEYKRKYKIPDGYKAYCACYFGYRDKSQPIRDRGPRKEGTITIF